MLVINRQQCSLPLLPEFANILDQVLAQVQTTMSPESDSTMASATIAPEIPSGYILKFRDPDYSAEHGGYHPVEVLVLPTGVLGYVTDFAYVGCPPYAELAKELDYDFSYGVFGHLGRDYPIHEGRELFLLFQQNFVSYYQSGIFSVSVSPQ